MWSTEVNDRRKYSPFLFSYNPFICFNVSVVYKMVCRSYVLKMFQLPRAISQVGLCFAWTVSRFSDANQVFKADTFFHEALNRGTNNLSNDPF